MHMKVDTVLLFPDIFYLPLDIEHTNKLTVMIT